jgi:hypothetical protein
MSFLTNIIRVRFRGEWEAERPYKYQDTVSVDGSIYFCKVAHTNQEPPNETYWTLMVQGGSSGGVTLEQVKADEDIADALTKKHANTNDPTADQKAALAGTSGTVSDSNRFVTNADARNSDARTPTAHTHDDRYYTESEVDTALSGKSDTSHNHNLNDLTEKSYNSLSDKPTLGTAAARNIHVGTTAPGSPSEGDLWVDTN